MHPRLVVFIDCQNAYQGAREAFHHVLDPHWDGQFVPLSVGEALVKMSLPYPRYLTEVRVYRGHPDATKDPRGYGACSRQCEAWRAVPKTTVITRSLRYPAGWPEAPAAKPEEKGIDVALAVDVAMMGVRGEYDVGIVLSTDTDLKPALEAIIDLKGNPYPRIEVAAWSSPERRSRRLSVTGKSIWCHWLTVDRYLQVADKTNYARAK